jgi:hypothetical protein
MEMNLKDIAITCRLDSSVSGHVQCQAFGNVVIHLRAT